MKGDQGKCGSSFTCTILCTCWLAMLRGTLEKTLRSSALTTLCARSTATPSSSKTDKPTLSFSLSLANSLYLFYDGVGISLTEVAGEATRRFSTPETMGVASAEGRTDGPFPMIRTPFLPMFAKGSSFLDLILAYISLLNLVVISIKKKKKKKLRNPKYTSEDQY